MSAIQGRAWVANSALSPLNDKVGIAPAVQLTHKLR